MLTLMLPCSVSSERQIRAKVGILKKYADLGYPCGIEIFSAEDLFDPEVVKRCERNLKKWLPESFSLSLHAPFYFKSPRDRKKNFFSSEEGLEKLIYILSLADRFGAEIITIHASMIYSYEELKKLSQNDIKRLKKEHVAKIKSCLMRARECYPRIKICVENMPFPWGEDRWLKPEENIFDFCFVDLEDFKEIVDPEQNVFVALDICHLAANLDSSEMLEQIKKLSGGLIHVQFSDTKGLWKPYLSVAKEGVIPGDGRIGERVSRELLAYFLEISRNRDLNIVMEVSNEDYEKPIESKVALERVVGWIKELT